MRSRTFWGLSTAILGSTCHGVAALGYFIDDVSCTPAMREAVGRVLDGSFAMVQAGNDNVGKADANPDGPEQRLISNLFGTDPAGTDPASSIKSTIRARMGPLLILRNNKFTTSAQLNTGIRSNNIKVYCDERRLKIRKKDPTKSFDQDVEELTATGDCLVNVAYAGQSENSFAQLQICPKLMKKIMDDDFKVTATLPPSFWTKLSSNFVTFVAKVFYAPIDRVQLADKVLLHELTHLRIGGQTDDVGGFFNAYGWKNCRKLARVTATAQSNADTWALYGSVSLLIQNHQMTVDAETGNVTPIAAARKRAIEAMGIVAGRWREFVA